MKKYVITMLGEKDHGKSTLIGNLLIATNSTTEARINEVKKASKSRRFEPAHILDSFSEEREQEMTIDTTRAEIVYNNAILELIDVPGHLELIKNMMSGASNSDIAVLMVSVKREEGFKPQTKRHIFLSSMFGTKALVVAVNKMDYAKYNQGIFEKTKNEVANYLKTIGFNKPVEFIPISAYNNENLVSISKNTPWYKGKPLIDTVRYFAEVYSRKLVKGGIRILVQDTMQLNGENTIFGILYNGKIRRNEQIRIEPQNVIAKVKNLYVKGKKVSYADEGTNVAVILDKQIDVEKGNIIYEKNHNPHKKGSFSSKMFIIKKLNGKKTKNFIIKINNNNIKIRDLSISKVLSPLSGEFLEPNKEIAANNVVYANISLEKPYPLERYEEYSELGRFAIYDREDFIGVGIVE